MVSSDASGNESMVDSDISDSEVSSAEDEEDKSMNRKIWRVILHWSNNNDGSDVLDAFKFFYEFTQALDHDSTIEKIMDSVHTFRNNNNCIGFKEALNKALMKHKYLICRTLEEDSEESSDDDIKMVILRWY